MIGFNFQTWIMYILFWVVAYAVLIWYVWKLLHKPIANIFRKQKDMLVKIGFKRLNKTTEKFTFKNATYVVDWEKTAWIDDRKRPHLCYLENEALPLSIGNPLSLKVSHDARLLNEIAGKNTVEQLVKGSLSIPINNMTIIALIVFSFVAGLGLGFIIHYFVMPPVTTTPTEPTFPPLP